MTEKKERPKLVSCHSHRVVTGCGNLYVTVGFNGGEPLEVFAILGKAGNCATCQNEALTRSVSLGLKYGVPLGEYVDELSQIRCPNPYLVGNKTEECLSCADGIARVLAGYVV